MAWGGIFLEGRTSLHVLARHCNLVPGWDLQTSLWIGPGFLRIQSNARPHEAGVCQQFLQDKGINGLACSSPDLNPIEHIWDIHQTQHCITGCPGVGHLIRSTPRHCREVIQAQRPHTLLSLILTWMLDQAAICFPTSILSVIPNPELHVLIFSIGS